MLGIGALGELALGEIPAGAAPEPPFESKYHHAWSEPVRERIARGLAVALIASGATVPPIAPFPETVAETKWHQPWSEPVRVRPALFAGAQQVLAPDPLPRVSFGWWAWLCEPVRLKPALPTFEQHVFEFDPLPFTKIDWFRALAEPVRSKPGLAASAQQTLALPPWPDISVAFAPPWPEPVRPQPPVLVPAAEQQFQPFDEDIIFVDRWFLWWSEPVRMRPALFAGSQQILAFEPQPFPFLGGGGGWYLPDPTKPAGERKIRKPGAPRQVELAQAPPTFAEIIAAQRPAQLADVLGARFAAALPTLAPPPLDLYVAPARPVAPKPAPTISQTAIDDVQDRLDAMEALRVLDETEQERKAQIVESLLWTLGSNA